MHGRLCAMQEKQRSVLANLKQALSDIISGIVGSNSDVKQENTVS
jgi:hypothetical protein